MPYRRIWHSSIATWTRLLNTSSQRWQRASHIKLERFSQKKHWSRQKGMYIQSADYGRILYSTCTHSLKRWFTPSKRVWHRRQARWLQKQLCSTQKRMYTRKKNLTGQDHGTDSGQDEGRNENRSSIARRRWWKHPSTKDMNTAAERESFDLVKEGLSSFSLLMHHDSSRPLIYHIDASYEHRMTCILSQLDDASISYEDIKGGKYDRNFEKTRIRAVTPKDPMESIATRTSDLIWITAFWSSDCRRILQSSIATIFYHVSQNSYRSNSRYSSGLL